MGDVNGLATVLSEVAKRRKFPIPADRRLGALAQADWEQSVADAVRATQSDTQGPRRSRKAPATQGDTQGAPRKASGDDDDEFFEASEIPHWQEPAKKGLLGRAAGLFLRR